MYVARTPVWLQNALPWYTWRKHTAKKVVHLTFDDGPVPEVTPWVLEILKKYNARATFFCVGDNVRRYPDIYQRILAEGHTVGNHTFRHLNGWKTDPSTYLSDVAQCAEWVDSRLFRPPYGKLRRSQRLALQPHYQIVLWDVLSGDFDRSISSERCLSNVLSNVCPGSIVVFHDSLKAEPHLRYVLPRVLEENWVYEGLGGV